MSTGEAGDCNPTLISPAVLYYSVDELLLLLSGASARVCVRVRMCVGSLPTCKWLSSSKRMRQWRWR